MIASADSETKQLFLICRYEDDAIVGTIALSQIFRKAFQNAYLGYQLFGGFTGRGFMTEAIKLALRNAFDDLELHRVEANVQPENKPSIAILKRNGFTKEGFSRRYLRIGGRWRDHERWAILKEDWARAKKRK
jgi:ribosomal-protein-alanine N-acetyltransferase